MSSLSTYLDTKRRADLAQDPDYGPPRFAHTYCAQCAADVGPGNAGLSSCMQHLRTTRPLPRKVGATPGLTELRSVSRNNEVTTTARFEWGTDMRATASMACSSNVTLRETAFSRVPAQSGQGSSTSPSASLSSDGKLCSRPLLSSSRTESS